MFNIFSWQHIAILIVVALVVVGPKDLPKLMSMAGKWARKGRSVVDSVRKSVEEFSSTPELNGLRAEMNELKKSIPSTLEDTAPDTTRPPRG